MKNGAMNRYGASLGWTLRLANAASLPLARPDHLGDLVKDRTRLPLALKYVEHARRNFLVEQRPERVLVFGRHLAADFRIEGADVLAAEERHRVVHLGVRPRRDIRGPKVDRLVFGDHRRHPQHREFQELPGRLLFLAVLQDGQPGAAGAAGPPTAL